MLTQPLSLTVTVLFCSNVVKDKLLSIFTCMCICTDLEQPVITVSSTSTSWTSDAPIIIGQPDSPSEIVLNCSVDAHPIPRVTWTSRNFIQDVSIHVAMHTELGTIE